MRKNGIIAAIRENDPSYNPIDYACERAGISRDLFDAAYSRVVCDGYYGPISADDWKEQDGREPSTVSEGLEVLAKVSEEVEGYRELQSWPCEHCDGTGTADGESDPCSECKGEGYLEFEETTADARDIRRDVFSAIIEIYGGLPW